MSYSKFKQLHQQDSVLVLGNVWDAQTAKLAEEAGFQALGTSSHAIAFTLGYADGENISVEEILFVVERILKVTKLPVSVDFEAGYSDDPNMVAQHVKQLVDIGVVGINLEDGKVGSEGRKLSEAQLMIDKIKAIKELTPDVFINARIDTYTTKHPQALEETINRSQQYSAAGADGIFVPLAQTTYDITTIAKASELPLNLFLTADLPTLQELKELGVKRLSHGAKIYDWLVAQNKDIFKKFISNPKLPQ